MNPKRIRFVTHHSIVLEPDEPGSYKFRFTTERGEISGRGCGSDWKDLPTIAPTPTKSRQR